ncbi:MAG: hypothetical protein M3007_05375 [Candidatus Eremiobacteraeota bacterium]|nr:hypothetical protein [Candidatus Eremiobacteraeota bacterium]
MPSGRAPPEPNVSGSIGLIVIEMEKFTELGGFPESVAVTTTVDADTTVGIPPNVPSEFSVRPAGRVPDLRLKVIMGTPPCTQLYKLVNEL